MPTYSYECPKQHEYEEVLPVSDYQKETKCPKCGEVGKKTITLRTTEPTFTEKLFPFYDKSLNKFFHNKSHRQNYMNKHGFVQKETGTSNYKQERMLYSWRNERPKYDNPD